MNITIMNNREVVINSSDNLGTQNENNASIMNFNFPDNFTNANKKIVFITDDGNYWDLITDNSYKITNAVTKYKNVSAYVWIVDTENDIDFRSKIWNISFNQNSQPDDVVPTEEEISGFDTMITQLNEGLTELQNEKTDLRREYAKVEEGLEDLNAALTEVDNIDIDASKTGNIATITITNKEGTEKTVQIEDGTDYVITQEDYQEIANVVEQDIADEIPTKTSDLENDSGFIDNTVNNLINYTLKTNTGSLINLEMNSSTYVITLSLKDIDGNVISTDTVDLPLESVVVGGSYDSVNKKIVLTLENGNTVDIPVGDLIAGLQTEITSNNKLASDLVDDTNSGNKFVTTSEKNTWNGQYTKPAGGIPSTDLSSAVQTSLGKADTAVQDVSGKEDKLNKVTSIDENSTNTQYPTAKLLYDQLAEKQEQIDGLVTENALLKDQIPNGTAEGTNVQITDSSNLLIEGGVIKGDTSQVQYTGKNLANIHVIASLTNQYFSRQIVGETIVLSNNTNSSGYLTTEKKLSQICPNLKVNDVVKLSFNTTTTTSQPTNAIYLAGANELWDINGIKTITQEMLDSTVILYGGYNETAVISEFMIRLSSVTDSTYEPYTNGASPNPDYPQNIHVVTGENSVKVENKNLANIEKLELIVGSTGVVSSSANTWNCIVDTRNINSLYVSGDFSLLSDNALRTGGFNEYPEVNSQGTRLTYLANGSMNTSSYDYVMFCFLIASGATIDDIKNSFLIEIGNTGSSYVPHAEQNYPVNLCSKNKFDKSKATSNYRLDSLGNAYADNGYFMSDFIEVTPNTAYTSNISPTTYKRMCEYDKDKNFISEKDNPNVATISTSATTKFIRISGLLTELDTTELEKGSTATSYTPYFTPIELCKIGDYQDYLFKNVRTLRSGRANPLFNADLDEGDWYKYDTIKKYIFDGNENWIPVNNSENSRNVGLFTTFKLQDIKYYPTNGSIIPAMCSDQYISKPNYYYGDYSRTRADFTISTIYGNIFYLQNGNFSDYTNEQVKNAMIGTILYYPLETPTYTKITDTTLIEQLEAYYNSSTYRNVTNIITAGEDLAPIASIVYKKDLTTLFNKLDSLEARVDLLEE